MENNRDLVRIAHLLQDPRLLKQLFGTKFFYSDLQEDYGKTSSTLRKLGFCDEEMRSGDYMKRIHPDDRSIYDVLWNRVNDGWEDEFYCEYRVSDDGGKWHWIETHAMILERQDDGTNATIIGVDREITSRKNAESFLKRQNQETQKKYEVAESLRQTGSLIASNLELSNNLILGIKQLGRVLNFHRCEVYSLESDELKEHLVHPKDAGYRLPDPADYLKELKEAHYPIIKDDLGENSVCRSLLVVPLKQKKRIFGVVMLGRIEAGAFRSEHLYPVMAFADILTSAVRNHQYFRKTVAELETDGLTGLLARRSFDRDSPRLWKKHQEMFQENAIAMADIDHFKRINDTYGHPMGDKVIKKTAELFSAKLRKGDIVARYGGEEFVAVLPNTTGDVAALIMNRIREACEAHNICDLGERVTVSIGIAASNGKSELSDMIAKADKALYRAKNNGRNRVELF